MDETIETTEAETTPAPSRKTKGTALQSYLWEQVSRQLLQDAKRKARSEGTSVKHVLIRLLRDWTYGVQPEGIHSARP